ncbi:MAG: transcription termination/antitermination NusG family protein, partial [Saprospiraceae bacterium]
MTFSAFLRLFKTPVALLIMDDSSKKSWYVLSVRPNAERKVEAALLSKGIAAIAPVQKQWRQWSDRRKCVEVVLFPR